MIAIKYNNMKQYVYHVSKIEYNFQLCGCQRPCQQQLNAHLLNPRKFQSKIIRYIRIFIRSRNRHTLFEYGSGECKYKAKYRNYLHPLCFRFTWCNYIGVTVPFGFSFTRAHSLARFSNIQKKLGEKTVLTKKKQHLHPCAN